MPEEGALCRLGRVLEKDLCIRRVCRLEETPYGALWRAEGGSVQVENSVIYGSGWHRSFLLFWIDIGMLGGSRGFFQRSRHD